MDENTIRSCVDTDAAQGQDPIFTSQFVMDKDLYYDFNLVCYHRTKIQFLIFLCLLVWIGLGDVISGLFDRILFSCLLCACVVLFIYLLTRKNIKIGYERMLLSSGDKNAMYYALYADKIMSGMGGLEKEFFYHQVTKFFETKSFILLHLQHNLFLTIHKDSLNGDVDEVKSFLLQKCTNVKKKVFIYCGNDKKWTVGLFIGILTASVIGIVVSAVGLFLLSYFSNLIP